ncbi:ABC transporter permease [Microlunatus parietis]|uniref:Peptide/nickel transport system permease protein n=1 Tax=Microlunatus parietis TaxID=682979 RepID=A0A7Y9L764_9ACTN|nr:ABC transporter permease [Microlunatus parietis]NYE69449.1 peptide/nickel transport system permease protein [Microlunatus parietis]
MRFLSDLWRILRNDKGALVGGVIVLIYGLVAIFGPVFVQVGDEQDASQAYQPPSWEHPLGTDSLGQGVLEQIIVGTQPIMIVGVMSAVITIFIGVAVGLLTGYIGGVVDTIVMRITDIFLTIPGLPLIIVLASVIHTTNPFVLACILSITAWAGLARAIRSQAMSLRSSDFVEAAQLQGVSLGNMIGRQLLPNVGPYVAIHFLLAITGAIYASVGLFLLGIAPISGNNWGIMINLAMAQGALYTTDSAFYLFSPMAAIVILQVSFVFFSRALDSVFNPRLRVQ